VVKLNFNCIFFLFISQNHRIEAAQPVIIGPPEYLSKPIMRMKSKAKKHSVCMWVMALLLKYNNAGK
jgi:hypothetical protein